MTVEALVADVHETFCRRNQTLGVAESCTGGLLGASLTERAGSSDFFAGGIIAYSNRIKRDLLGVEARLLEEAGAVSRPVARGMQRGLRARFDVDWAVSITGIAGPGGATPEKPVGRVYVGVGGPPGEVVHRCRFEGDRGEVRRRSVRRALEELLDRTR